jgi:hypothetical protein
MKIKTKHIFKIMKIISKGDMLNDFKSLTVSANESDNEFGKQIICILVNKLHFVENEVYELLADIKDMTKEEIEDCEIEELINIIKEILDAGFLKAFFKQSSGQMIDSK